MDLYHAREHLHDLAKLLAFMLGDHHDGWLAGRSDELDDGNIPAMLSAARAFPLTGIKAGELDTALGYFETNAPRMRYKHFRSCGLFVGSGAVEAGCKAVIGALGLFITASNSCTLGGSAIPLVRPANGAATADICVFAQSGLDTSMTYTVSGPDDVAVISKQPAGLGIIHLTLQVPSTAAPGARTLFIQNTNLDKTAASGVLEVY